MVLCGCARHSQRTFEATRDQATLALRRGDLPAARSLAAKGISLAAQSDSLSIWTFRLIDCEALLLQNDLTAAEALVNRLLPQDAAYDALRSRQAYLRARLLVAQGRLREAGDVLDHARQLNSSDQDTALDIVALLGQVQMRLGQWTAAESVLRSVVSEADKAGDQFHEARALNDLGMGRFVRNRFDEALPLFERALSFTHLENLSIYAVALYNAGMCYARLGEFDRAIAVQQRAIRINESGGSRVYFEEALGELGNTYVQQGDSRKSLPYLNQALAVATESSLRANASARTDAAVWAGNLASAYIALGNWDDGERSNDRARALNLADPTRNATVYTLNAAEIAAGRGRWDDAARLFNDALLSPDRTPWNEWTAHAGLASVAIAQHRTDLASRHFEAALDIIEKTRADLLQTDYKLTFLTRLIRFYQAYVDALMDQGQVARALEVADSSRARVLAARQSGTSPPRASAAALQRLARQTGTVWLSYWLAPARSYLWVVDGSGIKCFTLPSASEIEPLVRAHQSAIANAAADPLASSNTAGYELHRTLVQPAARSLPVGASVVIVPDGPLHALNFETLPVSAPQRHYWIEDVEIQVAPSLAGLEPAHSTKSTDRSLLLIGNPTPRPPDYPSLRYATREMTGIAHHFDQSHVQTFDSDRASPAAYENAHPDQFAFVHFTAHATANVESPLDSAVILSGPDSGYKLYARDVADRPLHADLVSVSACRSAGERAFSGEGLVGFAWAFLRAGARRVVAGLWDVDDRSTATLMDRLYDRMTAGERPESALRAAKLELIHQAGSSSKPYYWAPFELFTVVVSSRR